MPLAICLFLLKVGGTFYSVGTPKGNLLAIPPGIWCTPTSPLEARVSGGVEILQLVDLVDRYNYENERRTSARKYGQRERTISMGPGNGYKIIMKGRHGPSPSRRIIPLDSSDNRQCIPILFLGPLINPCPNK